MNQSLSLSLIAVAAITASLVGCGGGSSSSSNDGAGASATSYTGATPVVGSARVYSITIKDNSQNTISELEKDTIDSVNVDGSYQFTETDPNNDTNTVDGTNYSVGTTVYTDNSSRQILTSVHNNTSGGTTSCTYSPHGAGVPSPYFVGETWTTQYTVTCGTNPPISYTQNGQVVDLESVTISGVGTFSTVKIQSTLVWTTSEGTTVTQTTTNWRDTASGFSVKETSTFSRTGTVPTNGYAVSRTRVLQSTSTGS